MALPFILDEPIAKLARSYLSVAAKRPGIGFSTGDPCGFIDRMALDKLTTLEMVEWSDGCFYATRYGIKANQQFLENGR